jgi:GT2 family glycosyltransferase
MPSNDSAVPQSHSVIVPTHGRPDLLARCLDALSRAAAPSWSWDVVVVDNSLEHDRAANARTVESFGRSNFLYVAMEPLGLTAARHYGAASATGDVVSYLDDDSFVSETWLVGVFDAFVRRGASFVGGPNMPDYEIPPPAWLESFWATSDGVRYLTYLSLLDAGDHRRRVLATHVYGCNLSIRRDVLERVRGFNPDSMPPGRKAFQGDGETALSVKVEAAGYPATYEPTCGIRHFVPAARMTEEYFAQRAFAFGIEASFTAIRAERGMSPLEGVPREAELSALGSVKARLARGRDRISQRLGLAEAAREGSPEPEQFRQQLAEQQEAGWRFHRDAVDADSELARYVTRPDYLDAELWSVLG